MSAPMPRHERRVRVHHREEPAGALRRRPTGLRSRSRETGRQRKRAGPRSNAATAPGTVSSSWRRAETAERVASRDIFSNDTSDESENPRWSAPKATVHSANTVNETSSSHVRARTPSRSKGCGGGNTRARRAWSVDPGIAMPDVTSPCYQRAGAPVRDTQVIESCPELSMIHERRLRVRSGALATRGRQ